MIINIKNRFNKMHSNLNYEFKILKMTLSILETIAVQLFSTYVNVTYPKIKLCGYLQVIKSAIYLKVKPESTE